MLRFVEAALGSGYAVQVGRKRTELPIDEAAAAVQLVDVLTLNARVNAT